jgi:cytochrome oxidase assembly protein ShyY1
LGIGPDRHRAYAVQWFALALTLACTYFFVNLRRPTAP